MVILAVRAIKDTKGRHKKVPATIASKHPVNGAAARDVTCPYFAILRPHLEYKVPKPTPPGSRWQRLPTGHDLLSPLSYRDRHILNRAKNLVAAAEPRLRGTNKCAWAWLRRACPYSDSDLDPENYGVNHAESPPPRASKAKGKKSRGASSRRST